jgi:hypothetical protein
MLLYAQARGTFPVTHGDGAHVRDDRSPQQPSRHAPCLPHRRRYESYAPRPASVP